MEIMSIGNVAAQNIAQALKLGEEHVATIENAIKDEIQAMSSHFAMAVADAKATYEKDVADVKSVYSYVKGHKVLVGAVLIGTFFLGAIFGHVV